MARALPLYVVMSPYATSALLIAALLIAGGVVAQETDDAVADRRVASAARIPSHRAPVLDGRLDDPAWDVAAPLEGFVQVRPVDGEPATFPTVARIAIDDGSVYVGVRAIDPDPGAIRARLTRRDVSSASDWITVWFDSEADRRTAFAFAVNPAGVQRDWIVSDDGGANPRWDAIWEVETRIDDRGWTAELRIPLTALRYSRSGATWGLQVGRFVQRAREMSHWSPVPRGAAGFVRRFGTLRGVAGLPEPARLELRPYARWRLERAPGDPEDPFFEENDVDMAGGIDVKLGLGPALTLDATVNPDFGQVEADPAAVNLGVFETFFEERRSFFLEGAEIFRFGLGEDERVFYSRRVGRQPQGEASPRGGFVDVPEGTSIPAAVKLSGRTASGWAIGVLDAVTDEETSRAISADGRRFEDVVEPRTNYAAVRIARDFGEARTRIGGIATGVVRDLDETGLEERLPTAAWTGGLDLDHRAGGWRFRGWVLGSHVRGEEAAIERLQRAPARFFQRPDAEAYVEFDPTRTSLSGWAAHYELAREVGDRWRGGLRGQVRSPGFEINDLGFLRRADRIAHTGYVTFQRFEAGGATNQVTGTLSVHEAHNFGGEMTDLSATADGFVELASYAGLSGGLSRAASTLDPRALRGGATIRRPASLTAWAGWYTDPREPVGVSLDGSVWREDGTGSRSIDVSANVELRIASNASVSIGPSYGDLRHAWLFTDVPFDPAGEARFVFADLDQRTFGLTTRIDYTITPDLGVQLFAQPFVSAGHYDRFKEVVDPRADRFEDRFASFDEDGVTRSDGTVTVDLDGDGSTDLSFGDPDFNFRSFRSTLVTRWEVAPGSTIFFVWQQDRFSFSPDARLRLAEDLGELFDTEADHVFLVKVNGWISF